MRLQRPTPPPSPSWHVSLSRMYCFSHSKCTLLFIFSSGLFRHTHAHLHKYKQANRHQSEVASWDLFILHFHQLAFGLSTLATTRYNCYNTWRGGENSKLVSPWKPTFSSPVSTYKGFQSAPYREGDEEQWKNLIRLLGVFFPLWQLRFSGHF